MNHPAASCEVSDRSRISFRMHSRIPGRQNYHPGASSEEFCRLMMLLSRRMLTMGLLVVVPVGFMFRRVCVSMVLSV